MENYVQVVTLNEMVITRSTMKELLESLSLKGFVQVHKSFAINVEKIRRIDGDRIVTEEGVVVPLSRTYRDNLLSLIMI